MFSGIPDSVKLKNADGTTGRESQSMLASFSLATEDFTLISSLKTNSDKFTFNGTRLLVEADIDASSITIGNVRLQDGVSGTLGTVKSSGSDFGLVVIQNSQPLPTGAATEATLALIKAKTDNLDVMLSTIATEATLDLIKAKTDNLDTTLSSRATEATLALAKTDLDLIYAGMSTAANQITAIGHLATIDTTIVSLNAKFNSLGQKVSAASVPVVLASDEVVPISAASLPLPAGAATEATLASVLADLDKFTFLAGRLIVDGSGVTQPISAVALPLPVGASTSANQVTANASLASIDGKLPAALGQHVMAASLGVVIASDQSALPVTVASLPLPAGAATAANQVTGNTSLSSIDGKLTGVALDASLQSILTAMNRQTFTATRLLVDGSGVTQPISAAALPLPAGAATSALQTTANTSLASIDGKLTHGQATMANSVPVVIASDQAAVPISAASLPLPTGAATSALQTTGNTSLATIAALSIAQGAALGSNTGAMIMGSVTTAAPTYTTGQINPLSLDTSGNLRVTMSAGSTTVVQSTASNLNAQVIGNIASGTADSGNPVKIGGVYHAAGIGLTEGQRGDIRLDVDGDVMVNIHESLPAGANAIGTVSAKLQDGAGTAITSTLIGASQALDVGEAERKLGTYRAIITALAPAATATDIFTIIGSATKTVRIVRIAVSGTQTTQSIQDFQLIKRSTADTAGTSTTPTVVPNDSNDAAGTAVVRAYTANPTLGTAVGTIGSRKVWIGQPTPAGNPSPANGDGGVLYAATPQSKGITLRGVAQQLAVNLNSVTVTGGNLDIEIEWTEE